MWGRQVRLCALCHRSFVTELSRWRLLPSTRPISMLHGTSKRQKFTAQRTVGYKLHDVYRVVSDIDRYKEFLPWCQESKVVHKRSNANLVAQLKVGFPPILESYTSFVILRPPTHIRSVSVDGRFFSLLENVWALHPGPHLATGPTCIVHLSATLELRSVVSAKLATPFFEDVVKTLANAFLARCQDLYGPDHFSHEGESWTSNLTDL